MKRFTDTEKWRDPWYRELPPRIKCLWQFFCDTCDHAGVFQIDWKLASFEIGERVTEKDMQFFGDRIQLLPTGRYLIRKFIPFQSGNISDSCPAHKAIIKLVENHGLVKDSIGYAYPIARVSDWLVYGYPIAYPIARVQDKEEEKEIRDRGLGKGIQIPERFAQSQQFILVWSEWVQIRKRGKKSKDFEVLFRKQLDWLSKYSVDDAIEILNKSMRNGWTGIFPLNESNGNHRPNHKTVRGPSRTEGTYNANAKSLEHLVQRGLTGISDAERPSA